MAGTIYLNEWNGTQGAEVATSKEAEAIQFRSSDSHVVELIGATTSPMIRPNAGVFRSYEKWLRTYLEGLGGSASISNIEAFVSGSTPPDGVAIFVKKEAAYATPKIGGYE